MNMYIYRYINADRERKREKDRGAKGKIERKKNNMYKYEAYSNQRIRTPINLTSKIIIK